jgi:flagellar biogenesis protein FliO
MEQILHTFGVIAVMVLVIFAAYFLTKYVAAKANGVGGKTRHFRLIDRFSVSKDKMFVLISVGQSAYLIGITNQNMTVIDQKELSQFSAENEKTTRPASAFPNLFSLAGKHVQRKEEQKRELFSDYMKEAGQSYDE